MTNVIDLDAYRGPDDDGHDGNVRCPECGDAWWVPAGVTISEDGQINGYAFPVKCHECAYEMPVPHA
jgi:hypothetical protein